MKRRYVVVMALAMILNGGAVRADAALRLLDWETRVPSTWSQQPPASGMRLAQFQATTGREDPVMVVVFHFGQNGGGPVHSNIERWESQFSLPGGKPVKAVTQRGKAALGPVTWVELNGDYARGVGMGPQGPAKPGQTLIAAVLETSRGNVTFQMYGPAADVKAQRKSFKAMVTRLE